MQKDYGLSIDKLEAEVMVGAYIEECVNVERYLDEKILWMKDGILPEYFILVGGILR